MKNHEMLSAVNSVLSMLDPAYTSDVGPRMELQRLRERLEADIRMETAKRGGTAAIVRVANKIIHAAPVDKAFGAAMQHGRQCVCDGHRAIRFNTPLPLPPVASEADFINLDNVFSPDRHTVPVELPSVSDLTATIKIAKAAWTGKKSEYSPLPWSFGEGLPAVNPEYLLDMLVALPDCKAFAVPGRSAYKSPLYFIADNGDGLLLPVLRKDNKSINK